MDGISLSLFPIKPTLPPPHPSPSRGRMTKEGWGEREVLLSAPPPPAFSRKNFQP